ncbi:MAG TPA: hypothetical protein VMR14_13265 [Streptosporangiaceae bacterium]|nr:hypothetical protein [Streptosporangiaceae bacterium]
MSVIQRASAHDDSGQDAKKAEADAVAAQITAKEAAIGRYHAAFENGTMDDATAGPRLAQLTTEITQLKARHGELTDTLAAQPQLPAPGVLARLAGYLPALLTAASDPTERKAAIEALIHEIRLTEEGLIPVYKIPGPTPRHRGSGSHNGTTGGPART